MTGSRWIPGALLLAGVFTVPVEAAVPVDPMGSVRGWGGSVSGEPVVPHAREVEARIWLDRGTEPTLRRGDRSRIYYRVSDDAYAAVFHIDTDGLVSLVHPRMPESSTFVRGGRDYRLLFPSGPFWLVDEHPGMGFFFVVASPYPLDFSSLSYSRVQRGWDLTRVGRHVYRDPYVAMDDFVAHLIPDWEWVPYALDFSAYHVGQSHSYPRFLCYDCHTFRPYTAWNPYRYSCTSFRVVIYNDPYYYPATRYQGTNVVYVRPPVAHQPRFVFKERALGEPSAPMVEARPAVPRDNAAAGERLPERSVRPPSGAVGAPDAPPRGGGVTSDGGERVVEPPAQPQGRDGAGLRVPIRPSEILPGRERDRPTLERRTPPGGAAGEGTTGGEVRPPVRPPPTGGNVPTVRTTPPRRDPPAVQGTPPPGRDPPRVQGTPPPRRDPPRVQGTPPPRRDPPRVQGTPAGRLDPRPSDRTLPS